MVQHGMVRFGLALHSYIVVLCSSVALHRMALRSAGQDGVAQHGAGVQYYRPLCCTMAQYALVQHGFMWHGLAWHGEVCFAFRQHRRFAAARHMRASEKTVPRHSFQVHWAT